MTEEALRAAVLAADMRKHRALTRYQDGPQSHAANSYALQVATEELTNAKHALHTFLNPPKPLTRPILSLLDKVTP